MKTGTYTIDLDFDQVLDLIKQLPLEDKIRLSKELERGLIDSKLTSLLKAFRTDELDQATIDEEVEAVRTEMYGRSKSS